MMIIEVGSYECGRDHCHHTGGKPVAGHAHISVRNGAQAYAFKRPSWASLEYDREPFKSATEALRWAIAQLDANMRAGAWSADEDDFAELVG